MKFEKFKKLLFEYDNRPHITAEQCYNRMPHYIPTKIINFDVGWFQYKNFRLFTIGGLSSHFNDQLKERTNPKIRRKSFTPSDLELLFKRSVDAIIERKLRTGPQYPYLFFSKSMNQGYVTVALDYQLPNKSDILVFMPLITFLPEGKHKPIPGTAPILIENILNDYIELE